MPFRTRPEEVPVLLARHIANVLRSTIRFGVSTRRVGLLLGVVLGAVALALATASAAAAPFVIYPFV